MGSIEQNENSLHRKDRKQQQALVYNKVDPYGNRQDKAQQTKFENRFSLEELGRQDAAAAAERRPLSF
ncbi:hypothetical protein ES703_64609 [subsurface metagenome]